MRRVQSRPLARSEGLLIEHVADETVAYDTESKAAHCLSPLAATLFQHCDGRRSIDQLAIATSERLGEPVDSARVLDALAQLDERNLLVDGNGGLSRRDVIRRTTMIGAGAIASAPLITSIIAPTPAAAATPTCGLIVCCPCGTGDTGQPCCNAPTAMQCTCTAAEGTCKQCKPAGAASTDARCAQLFPSTGGFPPGVTTTANGPCPCNRSVCS